MNQQPIYNWHIPQRQAKAGLFIILYKAFITMIKALWPLLVILLFRRGGRGLDTFELLLIIIPAFILLRSLVEFYYFRFYIEADELIIKKGFINKKNIALPLAKIQAVHIEQDLLHQVSGCGRVIIDTAGTEKTEATIDAISMNKAEQLKLFLLQEKAAITSTGSLPVADTYHESPVITLSFRDVLKLGISANHIQTFFIVLAFAFSVFQNVRETFGEDAIKTVGDFSLVKFLANSIPLLIILILTLSVIVSMVRIIMSYFDFRLSETTQGLKLKTGLINVRQFLVPFSKIQFISWKANWARRKIGLYNLEIHQVAGQKIKEKQKIKVPITQKAFIDRILLSYHRAVEPTAHSVHAIQPAYIIRRTMLIGILPATLLTIVLMLITNDARLLLLLVWVPYVWLNAFVYHKNFRLFAAPDALQVNSGIWGRKTKIVKWYKIQQVILQQSIYQRRKNLATLKLVTAGGTIQIPFITLALAQTIRNYAMYEIERSAKQWM